MNIPEEFLEAARIDGANRWQLFWRMTLPLLAHTTLFVTVITLTGSFQVFDLILLMTNGGPGYATYVLSYLIYNEGIARNNLGIAAAVSMVMFLIILIFTIFQFRLLRPRWEY
jgi:multiple sugar transport system permease protein/alpha-1,4-digalacturonate transport system permease protein